MSNIVSTKWLFIVATAVCFSAGGVVFAKGGGHGGGGHGGGHGGHSGGHHSGGHHSSGHHHYSGGHHYGGGRYYSGGYGLNYGGYGYYGYGNGYYYPQVYSTYYSQGVMNPACIQGGCPVSTYTSVSPVVQTSMSQVMPDGRDIVLFNPVETGKEIQYSLNGSPYLIKPGGVQTFPNDRTWTIDMDTGTGQHLRYTLESRRYKFKLTQAGMGVFSTLDQPAGSGVAPANVSPAPSPAPGA